VTTRREGTRIYYSLAGDDVAGLYVGLRAVAQTYLPDTEAARRAYLGLTASTEEVDVDEVDRDKLLHRVRDGHAVVLDVRPIEEYACGHIPGAISIPVDELSHRLAELPAGRTIVAYCRGGYCVFAYDAVRQLRASGYSAARLTEGMLEWRLAGLPVTTTAA
jgi:rhodanese-related sulfurtransferase